MPTQISTKAVYTFDHLPLELWQHICSFLSSHEVWTLRELNQTLRNIALDARYRCIKINFAPRHPGSYASRFRYLGEDQIAKRVREIHFRPYTSQDPFDVKDTASKDDLKVRSPLKGIFEDVTLPDPNTVINTIARFKKVSSLRIEFSYDTRLRPPGLQSIHGGLRILANNLRSLVLAFPLQMMSTIILPDLVLTRLETFEFMPSPLERSMLQNDILAAYSNTLKTTILPFVNRHRLTLRSFKFVPPIVPTFWIPLNPKGLSYFNLASLYEGINHIPHLSSLSVSVPAHTSPNDATCRFFLQHSKTLRRLDLSMAHMGLFDYQHFLERFEVLMPQLDALTIDFGFRSRSIMVDPSLSKFLTLYSSSLKSLRLLRKQHGRREIFSLFETIDGAPTIIYTSLRRLEVWLYCLTPEILDMLASSLPNLEDLELTVRIFRGEIATIKNERNQFCVEMHLRNYDEWNLQRLIIKNVDSKAIPTSNIHCVHAVVEALPRLLMVNEVSRANYISYYLRE